jgi:ABC-type uncharacterized transport system ATPase subunit
MHGIAHVDRSGKEELTEPVQDVAKIAKRQVQVLATPEHNTTQHNTTQQRCAQVARKRHRSVGSAIGASGADPPNASSNGEGAGKTGM